MKNILLLDTNFSAKPIYDFLQKKGNVFVMGNRPDDYLAKICRNYINQDYANIDEVLSFIEESKIDYLVPGGNDFSYNICSKINQITKNFFNIDTPKIDDIINDKEKFRKFGLKNNLHVPKLINEDNILSSLPVIIKPVDAYSGHGITIINDNNKDKIEEAISIAKSYSIKQQCVIEEYIQGQLYSHSAFISNGKIIEDFIVKEFCSTNKYVVDISFVDNHFPKDVLALLREDIEKIAENLKLTDGLIHTQFIVDKHDFWLIEITRRCPGDLYSELIEFSTGFPYAEYYARPFLNIKNPTYSELRTDKNILRHTISFKKESHFKYLRIREELKIRKLFPLVQPGDIVQESPFGRVGLLFTEFNEETDMLKVIPQFESKQIYMVE